MNTCKDCKWWESPESYNIKVYGFYSDTEEHGVCHSSKATDSFWTPLKPLSSAGCIHWEEKK